MTTNPNEPQDADPTQLHQAEEAIAEAKTAAGRVDSNDIIDTDMEMDLPSEEQNVPSVSRDTDDEPESS